MQFIYNNIKFLNTMCNLLHLTLRMANLEVAEVIKRLTNLVNNIDNIKGINECIEMWRDEEIKREKDR